MTHQTDEVPEGRVLIRAFIVNEHNITLYDTEGNTYTLQNNLFKTREIIDQITPDVTRHRDSWIDLGAYKAHREFEKKTGKLTRFFRVAKSFVANIFSPTEGVKSPTAEDIERYGQQTSSLMTSPDETIVALVDVEVEKEADPLPPQPDPLDLAQYKLQPESPSVEETIRQAEQEVIQGLKSPEVNKPVPQPSAEQQIADVQKVMERQTRVIPEMEKLETQFAHAVKNDNVGGMQNFLKRIGAIIDKRGHTVQDLLTFIEKGDLPIASNGDVVGYKALKKRADGRYTDVHSGRVSQTIGSHVFMAPELVDPNRNRDCSYGLHIGRRDYMGQFGGDVIVLCRIRPEDFIAVPTGYASKVRVSGYHIVAELPKEAEQLVRNGKPMTTITEMAQLLGNVLNGNHIGITETVELQDAAAHKVLILNKKTNNVQPAGEEPVEAPMAKVLDHEPLGTLSETEAVVEAITPTEIRARVAQIVADDQQAMTAEEIAVQEAVVSEMAAIEEQVDIHILDTNTETNDGASAPPDIEEETDEATALEDLVAEEVVQPVVPDANPPLPSAPVEPPKPIKSVKDIGVKPNLKPSKAEEARALYNRWRNGQLEGDLRNLYAFKRGAKKGWGVLGFKNGEINEIENALVKIGLIKK